MALNFRFVPRQLSLVGVTLLLAAGMAWAQSATNLSELSSSSSRGFSGEGAARTAEGSGERSEPASAKSHWRWFSGRMAGEAGAGFNAPLGNDLHAITWGYNFAAGAGLHLNKRVSLLGEFQFIGAKIPGALMNTEGAKLANTRVVSIGLAPVIDLFSVRANSVYLTGGGGFYHKVTNFAVDLDTVSGDLRPIVADYFTSNQGGANLGIGFKHRLFGTDSRDQSSIFAEARYLFVNTPPTSATNGLGTTELIPVTIGLRW